MDVNLRCRTLSKSLLFTCFIVVFFLVAPGHVRAAQTPYGGNAWTIPGTIEVENFDEGGEGVSFHDLTVTNEGGAYRNTAVDIYASTNAGNGYYVVLEQGEWLEFTVNIEQTALYEMSVHGTVTSTYPSAEIHVFVDGLDVAGTISIQGGPGFGPWYEWLVPAVVLKAGQHVMKLELTREPAPPFVPTDVGLDYLKFELSSVVPVQVIAGSGQAGFADGTADQVRFSSNITGLDADLLGNDYFADAGNYRVRKISPSGDTVTLAGGGTAGTNDAAGNEALFDQLGGLAVDNGGNCYVVDRSNLDSLNKIRKISSDGAVNTLHSEARTDPATLDGVEFTGGIGVDQDTNIYFVVYRTLFHGGNTYTLVKLTSAGTTSNVLSYWAGQGGTRLSALSSDHAQRIYTLGDYYSFGYNYRTEIGFLDVSTNSTLVYQEAPGGWLQGLLADRAGNVFFPERVFFVRGSASAIEKVSSVSEAPAVHRGTAAPQGLAADLAGNVFTIENYRLIKLLIGYRGLGLSAFTDGGGTVTVDPPQTVFRTNDVVNITASPWPGWTFLGWTNDATGTQTDLTITMSNHLSLEAVFGATINTPATNGTVIRNPDQLLYAYGIRVQLAAEPDYGYEFVDWSDGSTNPTRVVEVTNVISLSPRFSAIPRYTLSAAVLGGTGGTVSRNPDQADYFRDTRVTVTAWPGSGYVFQVWLDNVLDNPRSVTITSNTTLFSVFAQGQGTAPVINAAPQDTTVFVGGQAEFSVSAQGSTPLEYQWQFNGTNISGATGSSLSISHAQLSDTGVYTVTVSNTVDTASATARLTVLEPFSLEGIALPGDGQFHFSIVGQPGTRYAIDGSDDLNTWQQIKEVDNVDGTVEFTESLISSGAKARFYRARLVMTP